MRDKLYFLNVIGGPVPDALAVVLYCGTQRCAIKDLDHVHYKSDEFEALIRSDGKTTTLFGASGKEFHATIESEHGTIRVSYVVPHFNLEPPLIEPDEILDIRYADPRATTAHLN